MDIDFNDLSEEQQKVLLNRGKIRGYSREENYIKCINTLPESKVTYCDKYLKE